jgi:hypothetical protein
VVEKESTSQRLCQKWNSNCRNPTKCLADVTELSNSDDTAGHNLETFRILHLDTLQTLLIISLNTRFADVFLIVRLGALKRISRQDISVSVNKSRAYVLNQSHATPVFINLLKATCFGSNYEPSSSYAVHNFSCSNVY